MGEKTDTSLHMIYIIRSTDMTIYGKHEGSGQLMRVRNPRLNAVVVVPLLR